MAKKKEIEISTLSWQEHSRERVGMYLGDTSTITVPIREVLDNGVDEILGGYADKLGFKRDGDYFMVYDNGRGMPISLKADPTNPKEMITSAEIATGRINSGSKYRKTEKGVGLNGVGTKAVNATSDEFIVCCQITKDNYNTSLPIVEKEYKKRGKKEKLYYVITYNRGHKKKEEVLSIEEIVKKKKIKSKIEFSPSTLVIFKPDYTIFESDRFDLPIVNLSLVKLISGKDLEFYIQGIDKKLEYELFEHKLDIELDSSPYSEFNNKIELMTSFEFTNDLSKGISKGSVNSLVVNRGLHIRELEYSIKEALIDVFKVDEAFQQYLTNGLNLSVIVLTNEVGFSSQTKETLTSIDGWNKELKEELRKVVLKYVKKNSEAFEGHIRRIKEYVASLNKLKDIDFIKSKVILSTDTSRTVANSKLLTCTSKDREECTLFIVEGDSAGSTIKRIRDPKTQALLPIKGKILNVVGAKDSVIYNNDEVLEIVNSIKAGVKGHELKNGTPHFGKVAIVNDSDSDGEQILSLLIGLFAELMPHYIEQGRLFRIVTPFFKQNGKYIYNSDESKLDKRKVLKRYKGIGSLNEEDAKETITGPNAIYHQITLEDVKEALEIIGTTEAKKQLMIEEGILKE